MKREGCLPPAAMQELEALEAEHHCAKSESGIEAMMAAVMDLGRWPLLRRVRHGSAQEDEYRLARRVRDEMQSGGLSKENFALLEEMRWMHQREQEAKHLNTQQRRRATRRARQRMVAIARVGRIKSLLGKLRQSKMRCTCYDFDCWAPLWEMDAALALDLRARGFHFCDCVLAPWSSGRGPLSEVDPRGPLKFVNAHSLAAEHDEEYEDEASCGFSDVSRVPTSQRPSRRTAWHKFQLIPSIYAPPKHRWLRPPWR